ncbi:hypothetical protein EP30_01085 [Bifidobacterium sp. UTCIF-39]|uniref:HK97 gp10 family phage protein n=1 Tax=Bifidobacterium sp. UTCIF-39 TaxID=1465359 RepID=UPI00112B009B|nr:HK97 gp10 family phage protein [Bifidobacterium sp. UTCIF-39]TPF97565.1 hypothetical protein EP30_01085 [Bifidobacterium sp. UTCIF-39]
MPAAGQTTVHFDDSFFEAILRSAKVDALCKEKAERTLAIARKNAPVDSGDYKRGLKIKKVRHAHRDTYLVVGTDAKTLLIESQTDNLHNALKEASG